MIYLLDYDAGNILSLRRALEYLNFKCEVTKDLKKISCQDILFIPGVGSYSVASKKIEKLGAMELASSIPNKRPFIIGICLGMQLLMSSGEEGGTTRGLNLIPGTVEEIVKHKSDDLKIERTLIGWQKFQINIEEENNFHWLNKFKNHYYYHVHSYMCVPINKSLVLGSYPDKLSFIPNIIGSHDLRVIGFQFHPEKSGNDGLNLLQETVTSIKKINTELSK